MRPCSDSVKGWFPMNKDEHNEEIGHALRTARKRRGWTQAEAARQLATHATQLARYELGQREAPLSFLREAESVYGAALIPGRTPVGVARETPTPAPARYAGEITPADVPGVLLAVERMATTLAVLSHEARLAGTRPAAEATRPATAQQLADEMEAHASLAHADRVSPRGGRKRS